MIRTTVSEFSFRRNESRIAYSTMQLIHVYKCGGKRLYLHEGNGRSREGPMRRMGVENSLDFLLICEQSRLNASTEFRIDVDGVPMLVRFECLTQYRSLTERMR